MIGDLRPALGGYVADVIAGWEPDELIARFEAELGPDLQYIRVNGAVLGALIGGLLFAICAASRLRRAKPPFAPCLRPSRPYIDRRRTRV